MTRNLLHTCPACKRKYQVSIDLSLHVVHKATCPLCGNINFFDNKNGVLEKRFSGNSAKPAPPSTPNPSETNPAGKNPAGKSASGAGLGLEASVFKPKSNSIPESTAGPRANPFGGEPHASKNPSDSKGIRFLATTGNRGPSRYAWFMSIRDTIIGIKNKVRANGLSPQRWIEEGREKIQDRGILRLLAFGVITGVLFFFAVLFSLNFPSLYLQSDPDSYMTRIEGTRPNRILDRNGSLIGELFSQKTGNLKTDEIPEEVKRILVFTEDENFYSHSGIHWPSIVRAAIRNVFSFGYSQGGSTLSQQLARILMGDREKSILRKLKEAALAKYLEGRFTKDQILTAYLNHVYLGHGSYGMDVASQFYFRKPLSQVDFTEAMILSSLPPAPERYSPLRNPDILSHKMDAVYERLEDANLTRPPREEFEKRKQEIFQGMNRSPTESVYGTRANDAPFVAEFVRLKIIEILGSAYEYGAGITVETTIDGTLQRAAVKECYDFIKEMNRRPVKMIDGEAVYDATESQKLAREYLTLALGPVIWGFPEPQAPPHLETAAIGVDPLSGGVLYMQGAYQFRAGNQLNRAINMRRQTGSAIKPIVYSAAIESGVLTAASRLDDSPIYEKRLRDIDTAQSRKRKEYWLPGNITQVYEGKVSVRRALTLSKNIPAIRTAREVGLNRLGEQFKKFFFPNDSFDSRFRYDETVAIGSLEMSPLEMASAFSAFAANGVIQRPYLIKRILGPNGEVLYDEGADNDQFKLGWPKTRTVIPGDVAEVIANLMQSSALYGGLRSSVPGTVMGKTGTSNDFKDAWFVGSIPGLTGAVWVGFDNPAYSTGSTGSGLAGPLWSRIAHVARLDAKSYRFEPRAKRIRICEETGLLATPNCPKTMEELFTHDHTPNEKCPLHQGEASIEKDEGTINKDTDFQ